MRLFWRSFAVFALLLGLAAAPPDKKGEKRVEKWADARLTVTRGLALWLDASRLPEARKAAGLPAQKAGDPLDLWPDASGAKRDVAQKKNPAARPTYYQLSAGDFRSVRFDGRAAHLRRGSGDGPSFKEATVFVVAAS